VLDDGMLAAQTPARFAAVMAPKAEGAWHLHRLTQQCDLDFFVAFSSAASLVGNPGQSNYAAANGFLDGLMQARCSQGLPGLSINWGPWAEVGMAAHLAVRMQARKIDLITPVQGRLLFTHLYKTQQGQIGVLPFQSKAIGVDTSTPQSDLRLLLESMEAGERAEYLMDWLCQRIASTLGLASARQVPLQQPLFELGIDSLMALELRKSFAAALGFPLSATLLFEYPTVRALSTYLLERLQEDAGEQERVAESGEVMPEGERPDEESIEAQLRRLEALLKGQDDGGTYSA
jgi:myxalamid-type polyketide synthase MxaB